MRRTNKLQIPLIFSLIVLLASMLVFADEGGDYVAISVEMKGDAYITIRNEEGSITIIYNGVNVLRKLASKAQVSGLKKQVAELRRELNDIADALDLVFKDLYSKVYFLAYVTGVTGDNSTIAMQIRSGNMTLPDFIEQLFNITESQSLQIEELSLRVDASQEEVRRELNELWNKVVERLKETQNEVHSVKAELQKTNERIDNLVEKLDLTFNDLYGKVYFLAHVTGVYGGSNSTVTLMVRSGNATLADFIDYLLNVTERQGIQIVDLSLRVENQMEYFNSRIEELTRQVKMLDEKALDFDDKVSSLTAEIESLKWQFNIFNASLLLAFTVPLIVSSVLFKLRKRKPKQP